VADAGQRLDTWLARRLDGVSRARVQAWLDAGLITRNHEPARRRDIIRPGDCVRVCVPPPQVSTLAAEPIPLDILHEDSDILVLNKPAGLVVHPAAGHASGTLVNALLHHGARLAGADAGPRPGIVHRLDRDTSGVLVVAKSERALAALADQFKERQVRKTYLALVWGVPRPPVGRIEAAIGRSRHDRKKMAVLRSGGRPAITTYRVLEAHGPVSLLELGLETGRTHQIRVHLAHLGHPVVGDPQYGARSCRALPFEPDRQMLHAETLAFRHPATGKTLQFRAPIPSDLQTLLAALRIR
jgi:23S rRNA pseudouridine1911/1915/1917 synthase